MAGSKFSSLLLSLIFILVFSGCKDDISSPDEFPAEKKLSRIFQDEGNYIAFTYEDKKLYKFENISDSSLLTSIILIYNGKKRPQTEEFKDSYGNLQKKYFYDSTDRLEKMEFMYKDMAGNYYPVGYVKYYFNNLNLIIKTEQYDTRDQLVLYFEYTYDDFGNIVEKAQYNTDGIKDLTIMTYDNKINPWYNLRDWFNYDASISKNNLTKATHIYYNGSQGYNTATFSYTYDAGGYPLTRTIETISNNVKTTVNSIYEYR